MKTMTLDEVKKLPPLTAEEVAEVMSFKNTDFSDCPQQTKEELAKFHPWYERRKDWHKPSQTEIHMKIDTDVWSGTKHREKDTKLK